MSQDPHPDRRRYGEDALTERHERIGKLARNIAREVRLLARLKRDRAGSESFGPAEVAECDRMYEYWRANIKSLLPERCDPADIPNRPEIPDVDTTVQ